MARKLCAMHYQTEWRKDKTLSNHPTISPDESFDARVKKTDTCWVWTGGTSEFGYGIFLLPGEKKITAHRYMYQREVGPIPEGLVLLHSCDNPPCVNPAHLRPGTKGDNIRDAAAKNRLWYGENHYNAKLTLEQVIAIRADNRFASLISREYGITRTQVYRIKKGTRWRVRYSC